MTLLVSLIARIDRVIMELSVVIVERPGLAWKAFEAVMGEAIPGPGPCSTYTRRISWDSEDEFLCA